MKRVLLTVVVILVALSAVRAQLPAAEKFMRSLDTAQRRLALFPFDGEERYSFHFFPIPDRKGIPVDMLQPEQLQAAMELMRACLSETAVRKVEEIMQLEVVLKAIENRKEDDHYRDPGKYCFSIFGIPGPATVWGWRLEGHHVSFHFSVSEGRLVAGTPGFLGANPAIVPEGVQKGKQVLKEEADRAFTLLHSLTADQLKTAMIDSTAPNDIFTYINRKAIIEHPAGIRYSELDGNQQQQLLQLVSLYVHRYTKLFADDMLKEIQQAGIKELRFGWAGFTEPAMGKAHYYRIQGPTIIIEYDNSQNKANHVHTVVRDLLHDYGGDLLLEHYRTSH